MQIARRKFLAGLGAAAASLPVHGLMTAVPAHGPSDSSTSSQKTGQAQVMTSPFRVAIINDEISQAFGRACEVAAREFGMRWIELRGTWNKNIVNLDAKEIAEALRIIEKFGLRVTDIASPLFKADWKGVRLSLSSASTAITKRISPLISRTKCWTEASNSRRPFKQIVYGASILGASMTRRPIAWGSTKSFGGSQQSGQETHYAAPGKRLRP